MKYEVIGRGAVVPGGCVLKLSEDQVRRRRLVLEEVKGKGWRVTAEGVAFKQGETFDLVEGHIDEKRGDLRRVGGKSPAEAREAKRNAARKAAATRRAKQDSGAKSAENSGGAGTRSATVSTAQGESGGGSGEGAGAGEGRPLGGGAKARDGG